LIFRRVVAENPTWGAPRIHGELLMLGFDVSERTISRWMKRAPRDPRPARRWRAFLEHHREAIAAMDFFTVPTITFGVLYCFFVIRHDRRRMLHFNITKHPTSSWIIQQLREAFPFGAAPRFLIHDRDAKYGTEVPAAMLGLNTYETAWTWLHKLRRAMVRPGRDLLTGRVEVDECYIGGLEEGLPGRLNLDKALIVVAAQEDGPGIGRIRMRQIVDASAASLVPFLRDSVEPGSVIHTDGWLGYQPLERNGYKHEVTFLKGRKKTPSELMPRVHRVISLLKRWLMGTHQGAVSHKHLDYYLDEFTFRFNRRRSKSRGKLFFRLVQQALAVEPVPLARILHPEVNQNHNLLGLGESSRYPSRFIPMQGSIKSILNGVVVIVVVLWLLNVFGLFHSLSRLHVGT
jgi:transposase-like protein